jgi:hypothetical protein
MRAACRTRGIIGMSVVAYWLDRDDVIVDVGGGWDEFARANDGPDVLAEAVVGRPLWHFVKGDTTTMWLESLLGYVRIMQTPATRTYRCDSPEVRRFMDMTVRLDDGGLLHLEHRLLRTEPRAVPVHFAATGQRDAAHYLRCSICGRLRSEAAWREPDDPATGAPTNTAVTPLRVLYGICDDCLRLLPNAGPETPGPSAG